MSSLAKLPHLAVTRCQLSKWVRSSSNKQQQQQQQEVGVRHQCHLTQGLLVVLHHTAIGWSHKELWHPVGPSTALRAALSTAHSIRTVKTSRDIDGIMTAPGSSKALVRGSVTVSGSDSSSGSRQWQQLCDVHCSRRHRPGTYCCLERCGSNSSECCQPAIKSSSSSRAAAVWLT